MNRLKTLQNLRNRYFAMRHGHSLANQQGLIVSDPENGLDGFGLSPRGREQVETSIGQSGLNDQPLRIVSSDFRRALESAQIALQLLDTRTELVTDPRLRERFFGELELGTDAAYETVWQRDAVNADHRELGVESASSVMARVTGLVADLEAEHADETFLLVSHGDALQILLTAFAGLDASTHRNIDHLQTAEIRALRLAIA